MRTKILSLALITALSCGCISSLSYAKDEESFIVEDEQFQKTETENEVQETLPEESVSKDQETEKNKEVINVLESEGKSGNWFLGGILPNEESLKVGEEHRISVNLSGNTEGLQYKYVWQKDGWKEWGVLQEFSEENETLFLPNKTGKYTLIVDIKDTNGKVVSKSREYNVVTQVWNFEKVETNKPSPQEKYSDPIEIKAITAGETEGLQYKFVWQKDNWKKWGVIQELSERSVAEWEPKEDGKYTILVDVKDRDGKIITKTVAYEITKLKWNFEEIKISPEKVQKKGQPIEIEASISGNTKKMQYKFVWMKDNWKEWGVIRNFSESNNTTWVAPKKSGNYQIIVDAKDCDGKVVSKQTEYFIATQIWQPGEVTINGGTKGRLYERTPISVSATGETENLQYKFVWMKDNWKEWGVIKEFDSRNSTSEWLPKEEGTYVIYADIRDVDGRKETITQEYSPGEADWKLEALDIHGEKDRFVGDKLKVSAVTSGNTEGLQYKFVCRRGNDWKDWEVVQGFSAKNSIEIPLQKDKDYHIHVDIKNREGVTCKTEVTTVRVHKYLSAGASSMNVSTGKSIQLYPNLSGSQGTYQVKYVWMKDNWKEWGVLKEFSQTSSLKWTPTSVGTYTIIMDVKLNGITQSRNIKIEVSNKKNGWFYEGGYKFYYKEDVKQLDLDGILPKQSSYFIKVNRKTCSVTVYAKDGNNGYIIPVKRFACSVGLTSSATPKGTYYTPAKYRWHTLMGPSYGQYCTRITGSILFHSVAGYNKTSYNIKARDYNKLGMPASHGCVRLNVRDAKWIYDNCPLKTKVTIYDSSDPGPLGKPATIKIPAWQNWDPTDPNVKR